MDAKLLAQATQPKRMDGGMDGWMATTKGKAGASLLCLHRRCVYYVVHRRDGKTSDDKVSIASIPQISEQPSNALADEASV